MTIRDIIGGDSILLASEIYVKFKNILFYFLFNSIMVLDKGSIIEFDTPKSLLNNKNSYFYSIALSSGSIIEELK